MERLCFATNNANKLSEIRQILGVKFDLVGLEAIGCTEELPETQETLEGNSRQKARYVLDNYQVECFADDTGLEVESLDGDPGVYSARYAGPDRNNEANIELLLNNLSDKSNRSAQFRTVITLVTKHSEYQFEGIVKGRIIDEKRGEEGFGYDPVFVPDGYSSTFAEMSGQEKNKISHRGRAVRKLIDFLLTNKLS